MTDEPVTAQGGCLCGQVRYGLTGRLPPVGFCHCSKCRRVSGTGSNAVMSLRGDRLVWLAGETAQTSFVFDDGWGTTFCSRCGSPTPRLIDGRWFVPAGGLDDDPGPAVAGHIWVGSKPAWAVIGDDAPQFPEGPPAR
jgi:hypothetical protein